MKIWPHTGNLFHKVGAATLNAQSLYDLSRYTVWLWSIFNEILNAINTKTILYILLLNEIRVYFQTRKRTYRVSLVSLWSIAFVEIIFIIKKRAKTSPTPFPLSVCLCLNGSSSKENSSSGRVFSISLSDRAPELFRDPDTSRRRLGYE